jgi:hypothetical protein
MVTGRSDLEALMSPPTPTTSRAPLTLALVAAGALVASIGCGPAPQRLDPEAARAKGDALLREMSTNLAAAQTFSFAAEERREQVTADGKRTSKTATRRVTIRRPNAFAFTGKGEAGDVAGWYDGKQLTIVSHAHKVWARGPMPATLDESLDFLATEYRVPIPTADLLYSSPYDALITSDTTGGWVDVQKIGDLACDHLAYRQAVVDWEIWLGPNRRLPCQLKITYKNEPGQPSTTVVYHALDSQVPAAALTPAVPDGYQRIKIMRHATVSEPDAIETPAATATSGSDQDKPR